MKRVNFRLTGVSSMMRIGSPGIRLPPKNPLLLSHREEKVANIAGFAADSRIGVRLGPGRRGVIRARQNREKGAAFAEGAGDADVPALGLHDAAGERQAEARAGFIAQRPGDLAEILEELRQVFRADADAAVLHFQAEMGGALGGQAHADGAARGGEFQGVGEVIVEDLLKARRVGDGFLNPATGWNWTAMRFLSARGSRMSQTSRTSALRSTGSRWNSMRPDSTLARSSTSLIRCRRCRALVRISSRNSRCTSDSGPTLPSYINSAKPMMPLRGVRSSWDIFARKRFLISVASRAAASARASCSFLAFSARAYWPTFSAASAPMRRALISRSAERRPVTRPSSPVIRFSWISTGTMAPSLRT